jgi:hypothetical protein
MTTTLRGDNVFPGPTAVFLAAIALLQAPNYST